MFVPPEVKKHVGFLCIDVQRDRVVEKVPVGTCFWIVLLDKPKNLGFGYLVTAKHVWEKLNGQKIYVRLNKSKVKGGETGITHVQLPDNWKFHSDAAVDLAVLPWSAGIEPNPNFEFHCFTFDEIAHTQQTMRTEGLPWPPKEGEDLIYIGLLTQYSGYERNFPVVRRGHLALVTDELVMGVYGLSTYYFIDMQVYPGHSGGPVWIIYQAQKTGVTMFLLGILAAADPLRQELYELPREHRRAKAKHEKIGYYSTGISLVVPVSKLVELLASPEMEEMRKRDEPKPVKALPLGA